MPDTLSGMWRKSSASLMQLYGTDSEALFRSSHTSFYPFRLEVINEYQIIWACSRVPGNPGMPAFWVDVLTFLLWRRNDVVCRLPCATWNWSLGLIMVWCHLLAVEKLLSGGLHMSLCDELEVPIGRYHVNRTRLRRKAFNWRGMDSWRMISWLQVSFSPISCDFLRGRGLKDILLDVIEQRLYPDSLLPCCNFTSGFRCRCLPLNGPTLESVWLFNYITLLSLGFLAEFLEAYAANDPCSSPRHSTYFS